ncbi:MAG: four helix bundle protein [Balneolaceae bacterium]|nr:four helix bundle protein [Balneolaceae bacterium]
MEIWQEARILSKIIFQLTEEEAFRKDYKLKNQIKGSSGSTMDNIAEGFERNGKGEFIQFLSIAKGSCGETRSQSYRAFDYEYITHGELDDLVNRCTILSRKISSLMAYLKNSKLDGSKYKQP